MPFFVGGDISKKPLLPCRGRIYAARGLAVSSRPPYPAPTPAATQKPVETLRFQPVLVRLQELESWAH